MEPSTPLSQPTASDSSTSAHGHARTGSLENPEVVENVPGHVIPILAREFDDFDTEAARFRGGICRRTTSSSSASSRGCTVSASQMFR